MAKQKRTSVVLSDDETPLDGAAQKTPQTDEVTEGAYEDHSDEDQDELSYKVTTEYNADSLRVLEGREAVRQRPAMYIGDTGSGGLHHLFYEILDNCIDEVLAGRASEVNVVINEDRSISVTDDGNGIPADDRLWQAYCDAAGFDSFGNLARPAHSFLARHQTLL